jgi:esterase/lipase
MEASPFNIELAKKYGMNIYLARMNGHGSDEESMMLNISPQKMMDSALEAVEVGKKIGKKVILLTTSTGGTLSTGLMANDEEIFAAINHSPNYELADPTSHILLKPFGLQIARLVKGGKFHSWDPPQGAEQYWTINYRIEALQTLRTLINKLVTKENLSKIKQPVLIAGYYKDEENQDDVVSVKAMEEAFENLGTEAHVFTSPFFTEDLVSAKAITEGFIENVLQIEEKKKVELIAN